VRFVFWSYRYAEQILNSRLAFKKEVEDAMAAVSIPSNGFSRPQLNKEIEKQILARGWSKQPLVSGEREERLHSRSMRTFETRSC